MLVSMPSSAARGRLKLRWRCAEMAVVLESRRVCGFSEGWESDGGGRRRKSTGAEFGGDEHGAWFKAWIAFEVKEGARTM